MTPAARRGLYGALVFALVAGLLPGMTPSRAADAAKAAPAQVAPPPPPPLEPEALARVKAMSDLLKGAKSFTFTVVSDREQPTVSGQWLDFFSVSNVSVTRPNRLHVQTEGDRFVASLWYDGKTLSIHSDKSLFYGQIPAPATIDETLELVLNKFQIPVPVAGFLLKDPYARMLEGVKTAFDAGTATIDGVMCTHVAFSEDEADWQVWIETGAKPLPRRIAVTYKKVPGTPRIVAVLSNWNLTPAILVNEFTFAPPAGATKVDWKMGLN